MATSRRLKVEFIPSESVNSRDILLEKTERLALGQTALVGDPDSEIQGYTKYTKRDDYREGRRRSQHGVYFADITLSNPSGDTTYSKQPVAVKPFEDPSAAVQDFVVSNEINKAAGGTTTFIPVGFLRQPDGRIALITKFEEGVKTFDTVLQRPERPTEAEIRWALRHAAETLFFLHANDWIHGDAQIQNTAYDSNLNSRIVDVTDVRKMTLFDDEDIRDLRYDLKRYLRSLNQPHPQELNHREDTVTTEQAMKFLIEPYEELSVDIPHLSVMIKKFKNKEYTQSRLENW